MAWNVLAFLVFYPTTLAVAIAWLEDQKRTDRLLLSGVVFVISVLCAVIGPFAGSADFGTATGLLFLGGLYTVTSGAYFVYQFLFGKP